MGAGELISDNIKCFECEIGMKNFLELYKIFQNDKSVVQ